MDQGAECDRGHLMDGRHALAAAAVRLSLRGGGRVEAIGDLQGDGTAIAEGDHQSGDDRDLAGGALPRLGRPFFFGAVVTRKTPAGHGIVGFPRVFCPLRQGFRRRPQYEEPKILWDYKRGTDDFEYRDRYPGSGEAILTFVAANSYIAGLVAERRPAFTVIGFQ